MKILFAGGGTLGSVTPLLAVAERLCQLDQQVKLFWLGTATGPEKTLVAESHIWFRSIPGGKWRRYWSWQNFIDLFKLDIGCIVALYWLIYLKPQIVVTAGSFISVPVGWAAWILGIPVIIHQQDVIPSLSNKLLQPVAKKITSVWPTGYFDQKKLVVVGNPIRHNFLNPRPKDKILEQLGFTTKQPVVLMVGGGTGAEFLNNLVADNLPKLLQFAQIIHITGQKKLRVPDTNSYRSFALVTKELFDFFTAADLVVTRAGMGFLSELGSLAKAAIVIPIPQSHQEFNAEYLTTNQAAYVLSQNNLTAELFINTIASLLSDAATRQSLGANLKKLFPSDADVKIAEIIKQLIK